MAPGPRHPQQSKNDQPIPSSSHPQKRPQPHGSTRPRDFPSPTDLLPYPILTVPLTPRGTPAEWAPPPPAGCLWWGWAPGLILPKPQGGSDNRRGRRRGLVRWASDLSPNRFESLFVLLVFEEKRERKQEFPAVVLPQLRRRGHARQTDPDASRLRAKTQAQTDAQTGLPRPGHGSGGLGSPGNPRFPSESVRHLVPARSSYQEQTEEPR